jgi:hypothetical protein
VALAQPGERGSQLRSRRRPQARADGVALAQPGERGSQQPRHAAAHRDHGQWRSPSPASEDRNLYATGATLSTADMWRSPSPASEDRNTMVFRIPIEVVSRWRSPSPASEDRYDTTDMPILREDASGARSARRARIATTTASPGSRGSRAAALAQPGERGSQQERQHCVERCRHVAQRNRLDEGCGAPAMVDA